jgi:hypothetical protein
MSLPNFASFVRTFPLNCGYWIIWIFNIEETPKGYQEIVVYKLGENLKLNFNW